ALSTDSAGHAVACPAERQAQAFTPYAEPSSWHPASANRATARYQPYQEQQDNCAGQAGEETEDKPTTGDVDAEQRQQESAEQAADNANDDIEQNPLLLIGFHNLAGDPPGDTADDDPADDPES